MQDELKDKQCAFMEPLIVVFVVWLDLIVKVLLFFTRGYLNK